MMMTNSFKKRLTRISIVVFFGVLFATKITVAQTNDFKLSDYRNPDYLYQTLDLNFGLNSGLIRNYVQSTSNSTNSFTLYSSAGATYSYYKNSPATQAEKHISFDAGIGSHTFKLEQDDDNSYYKSGSFSHAESVYIEGLKRFYNGNLNYFEVNGTLSARYNGLSDHNEGMNSGTIETKGENNQKNLNLNLTGAFIIGKGRIEQVQDARLAVYILEDLQKLDRTAKIASDDDILALAKEITTLKYKRFFDNRLRKIAEITAIDAFMQKQGIAGNTDAAYFTSLNDNWDFANNPVRYSGKRFFTGLEANYGYEYKNSLFKYLVPANAPTDYQLNAASGGLSLVAGFDFEKPKSLRWQTSSGIKVGAGMQTGVKTEKESDTTDETKYYLWYIPTLKLTADYGFGYYPNSRTWLTFKWWLLSGWDKEMDGDTKDERENLRNVFYTYTGPQFNAYFYLSEKLRLSLTFNGELRFDNIHYTKEINQGDTEEITSTWWNQQINAALTYSLF